MKKSDRSSLFSIIHILGALLLFALIASCNNSKSSSQNGSSQKGWKSLFNGKNLSNWVQKEGKSTFTVKDGMIVGTTVPNGGNGILATKRNYSDFLLELDVKIDTSLNSGIQIRSHTKQINGKQEVYGYQVEIDPSSRAWSGGIYDSRRRGWLVDLKDKPKAQKAFKNGKWNHYRIKADGDTIKTWVNSIHCATLIDSMDSSGFIGLQVHQRQEGGEAVRFKNIRIKTLK